MRSEELFFSIFKIEDILACLSTDGNDSVEKAREVRQERRAWSAAPEWDPRYRWRN